MISLIKILSEIKIVTPEQQAIINAFTSAKRIAEENFDENEDENISLHFTGEDVDKYIINYLKKYKELRINLQDTIAVFYLGEDENELILEYL